MSTYLPSRADIRSIAGRAALRNTHPRAQGWLQDKVDNPPADWDERTILTVPGIVWSVSSDTCGTGRLSAPDNVAYDHDFREFVFRQPRNEAELAAVMSADSDEIFACYRFDGLDRWTDRSVGAWHENSEVVLGYVRHSLRSDPQIDSSLRDYEAYLTSKEFGSYLGELRTFLREREQFSRATSKGHAGFAKTLSRWRNGPSAP